MFFSDWRCTPTLSFALPGDNDKAGDERSSAEVNLEGRTFDVEVVECDTAL